MFTEKINIAVPGLDEVVLPKMARVRQHLNGDTVPDVRAEIWKSIDALPNKGDFRGKRMAITVGSRGVADVAAITKAIADKLKDLGAQPFIIPAMGSHGGGTPEGQRQVIADYGVTEQTMGVPIISSMEVVQAAELPDGMPVYCDKAAWESDGIVVVNRVKPHTMFKGDHESGLLKMCAIGIGKHKGAATYHRRGFKAFSKLIPEAGQALLATGKVLFGVASVENGHEKVKVIEAIPTEKIFDRERELLKIAKSSMAKILLNQFEVLVVDEMGKNISGDGMDPNVIGRNGMDVRFDGAPEIETIVVLGLTKETHGNATGIGGADITTLRTVGQIDLVPTYINHITSGSPSFGSIPIAANDDEEALRIASMCTVSRDGGPRYVHIKNTIELEEIEVSENMMDEIRKRPGDFTIISEPAPMNFENNRLKGV